MFDDKDEDAPLDPAVQHALGLLIDCSHTKQIQHAALVQALGLVSLQIHSGGEYSPYPLKHWRHVYAVLNGERAGNC